MGQDILGCLSAADQDPMLVWDKFTPPPLRKAVEALGSYVGVDTHMATPNIEIVYLLDHRTTAQTSRAMRDKVKVYTDQILLTECAEDEFAAKNPLHQFSVRCFINPPGIKVTQIQQLGPNAKMVGAVAPYEDTEGLGITAIVVLDPNLHSEVGSQLVRDLGGKPSTTPLGDFRYVAVAVFPEQVL